MALLEVTGLSKRFSGVQALDAVSFSVDEGRILGLFGPNGAGKTTCFNCLTGVYPPDAGRVVFAGRVRTGVAAHAMARTGLARTFQIVKPFRGLTAQENVIVALGRTRYAGLGSLVRSWRGRSSADAARRLLGRVGLASVADRAAGVLPLGMLKRLEVARALALSPCRLGRSCSTSRSAGSRRRKRPIWRPSSARCATRASRSCSSSTTCASR
jgi:branched-chain amino acid transport system ATP-binding protein